MSPKPIRLASIEVPEFDVPQQQPQVSPNEYRERIEAARSRAAASGYDHLVVYGDREHFANLAYLTDHDPRFEEALLIISVSGGEPVLIVGNEGLVYSELVPIDVERKLYQGFSLLGQKRDESPRLVPVLRNCGINEGDRIGLAGWKYASEQESDDPEHWLEVPAFVVAALQKIVGYDELVVNATSVFMNPENGLRITNSAAQLAAFEFAAAHCSDAVRELLLNIQPGVTELEAVQSMRLNGLPLSAHLMFSTGPRARLGLSSPTDRTIERGDSLFVALGLRGALVARAGFVVADSSELPSEIDDYLERLVKPYFATIASWYESVRIGITGGELQAVVDESLAGQEFDLSLNPGHLIHLDEWVHSPVFSGSQIPLRSGMLVQCDLIPAMRPEYHTTNVEDTIALADQDLRDSLARNYPEMWRRIELRRDFMRNTLGIHLHPEVLPFSNLPAVLQPFLLEPESVLVANHS